MLRTGSFLPQRPLRTLSNYKFFALSAYSAVNSHSFAQVLMRLSLSVQRSMQKLAHHVGRGATAGGAHHLSH